MSGSNSQPTPLPPLLGIPDAQNWLGLDGTESEAQLEAAVQVASDAVLAELGWDPRSQTYTERVDGRGSNALKMRNGMISAVGSITLQVPGAPPVSLNLSCVSWDQSAPVIYNAVCFPRIRAGLVVAYTAGYAVIPSPILQAARYTIKAMLDGSNVDFNATGESYSGVLSQTFWQQGPAVVPPSAITLLNKFRRTI